MTYGRYRNRRVEGGRKAPLKPPPRDRGEEQSVTGGRSYMDRLTIAGKADAAIAWMQGEST